LQVLELRTINFNSNFIKTPTLTVLDDHMRLAIAIPGSRILGSWPFSPIPNPGISSIPIPRLQN